MNKYKLKKIVSLFLYIYISLYVFYLLTAATREAVVNYIWICPQVASCFYSDKTKVPPDVLVSQYVCYQKTDSLVTTAVYEKSQMAGSRLEKFGTVFTR